MNLKDIKAMFAPGDKWTVSREGNNPLIVNGNLGQTALPAINGIETRTVKTAKSELVWTREGRDVHTTWPKASEVLEARVRL